MNYQKDQSRIDQSRGERLFGLDFGKYLLSSSQKYKMESDLTGESDTSDWEQHHHGILSSDFSEESDEYGVYYGDGIYDTAIDSGTQYRMISQQADRQANKQARNVITQLNAPTYGPGLYPIRESGDSGTNESSGEATYNEEDEDDEDESMRDVVSKSGSRLNKPVYGRYQKLRGDTDYPGADDKVAIEQLMLHRLPGENLGMILGIEGGKDPDTTVTSVMVKSVTLGGAAYRASGGSKGVCAGDQIMEVNGQDLLELSHDECISIFKDMPLQVLIGIQRGKKNLPPVSVSPLPLKQHEIVEKRQMVLQQPVRKLRRQDFSDSEEESYGGFAVYQVTVDKEPDENLGLSIVPSYGSTKEYYQIKRILPSGAAAQSGQLCVGDRLILCNGTSLRGLHQSRCLDIIRSASAKGSIHFEVIRPVYDASSMEISVTLNSNTNGRLPGFDPLQYSVKSQSYDRNVDVIVTSESEDYLTVSDDDYSRKRLGNIPEVEANELFATHSVKLAYQKPISTIFEESTETETDIENLCQDKSHIRRDSKKPTQAKHSSPVPSTDLDNISIGSGHKSFTKTDLDSLCLRTPSPSSPRLSSVSPSQYRRNTPYHKRQQVPLDGSSRTVSPPPEIFEEDYLVPGIDRVNTTKYNPLYSDSNLSDQVSDLEASPDLYVQSPYESASESNQVPYSGLGRQTGKKPGVQAVPTSDIDNVLEDSDDTIEAEEAVPPPIEFSDNQLYGTDEDDLYVDKNAENSIHFPVTNIDDLRSEGPNSVKGSPEHKPFKGFHTQIPIDSKLAFNSELTAPFDSVLQEQGDFVQNTEESFEITDSSEGIIQRIVSGYDTDDITNIHFEPAGNIEKASERYRSTPHKTVISIDTTMDQKSESMLKDALDMEYEHMPESSKMQSRVELGLQINGQDHGEDDQCEQKNVAAEMIAKDMVRNENGNYGYYMESDDEPDQFPEADGPEDAPALPMSPPPMMELSTNGVAHSSFIDQPGNDNEYNHLTERSEEVLVKDSNWSFKMNNGNSEEQCPAGHDDAEIVPVVKSRMIDIPIDILEVKVAETIQDDNIIPMKVERNFELPSTFKEVEIVERHEEVIEESKSVLTKSPRSPGNKKAPPVVAPKPRKNVTTVSVEPLEDTPVDEVMEAVVVEKDLTKNIVNVISVVNALKKKARDKDPDVVDVIKKEEKVKDNMAMLITVNEEKKDVWSRLEPQLSPPKHEQVVSETDKIKLIHQQKNPKEEDFVSVSTSVKKTSPRESPPVAPKPRQSLTSPRNVHGSNSEARSNKAVTVPEEVFPPIPSAPIPHKVQESEKSVKEVSTKSLSPRETPTSSKPLSPRETPSSSKPLSPRETPSSIKPLSPQETPKPAPRPSPRSSPSDPPANTPAMKSSITVEKAKLPAADKPQSSDKDLKSVSSPKHKDAPSFSSPVKKELPVVPPLNLSVVTGDDSPLKEEDQKPKSESISPTSSSYKTTIGVKPGTASSSMLKPLSQIKPLSFNPKSLSQTMKPGQYKTTISSTGLSSTLGRPSLSSSLASQKIDHPIKRMETMPFEVSILKGILGLGIKTTMTPEGLVQVTEILPSGPVGREGNIKVGDYLLSINGTSLIGQTDSKVQQILRLLPRGLSKIVASPVKPDTTVEGATTPVSATPVPEKLKLSPRSSAPLLSASKQPAVFTAPKPPTFPAPAKREVKPIIAATTKSVSPHVSPRTHSDDPTDVAHTEVTAPSAPAETLILANQLSPLSSPRQQDSSPKISPRTPPPVAPKPKRPAKSETITEASFDSNEPIETEIFVSVSASTDNTAALVSNRPAVLPGDVSYDSVQTVNKTDWTPGVVSSSDILAKDMVLGKPDVVQSSMSPSSLVTCDIDNIVQTPSENNTLQTPNEDTVTEVADQTNIVETPQDEQNEAVVECQTELQEDIDSGVSESLYANRSRTFSTGSSHSSYTDFHECNVEDEIIPEQIAEEEESPVQKVEPTTNNIDKDDTAKDDDYESDFEEEAKEESIIQQEEITEVNTEAVRQVAESIVSSVIDSVMKMDLTQVTSDNQEDVSEAVESLVVSCEVETMPAEKQIKTSSPKPETVVDSTKPLIPSAPCEQLVNLSLDEHQTENTSSNKQVELDIGTSELLEKTSNKVEDLASGELAVNESDISPSLPDIAPPPIPTNDPPTMTCEYPDVVEEAFVAESSVVAESSQAFQPSLPVPVVDMTLYPDDSTDESTDVANDVIDVVHVSQTVPMHETAPSIACTFESLTVDINNDANSASEQVIDSTKDQSIDDAEETEDPDGKEVDTSVGSDEQNYNAVLSMYSNLEKSLGEENANIPVKIIVPNDNSGDNVQDKVSKEPKTKTVHDEAEHKKSQSSTQESNANAGDLDDNANETNKKANKTNEIQDVKMEKIKADSVDDDVFESDVRPARPGNLKQSDGSQSDGPSDEIATPSPRRVDDILHELEQNSPVGKYSPETERMIRVMSMDEEPVNDGEGKIIHVNLTKGVTGLGFVIQGGKMSPKGDLPITVKRIFKGGPADGILQVRDEIVEVDGDKVCEMRHSEAWNHLKFLPSGQISLTIKRYQSSD